MNIWEKLGLTKYEEIEVDAGLITALRRVTQIDYSLDSLLSFSQMSELLSGNPFLKYSGIVTDNTFVIRERYSFVTYFSAHTKITGFIEKIDDEKIKVKLDYAILNRAKFLLLFFTCFLGGIVILSSLITILTSGFSLSLIPAMIIFPLMIVGLSFLFVTLLRSGQRQAEGNFKLWATYMKNMPLY